MIQENINSLIMKAMKEKNEAELRTYRAVKTSFMEWTTAKNAKPLDETAELNIIRKMIKEREENIVVYSQNGREDLANAEREEAEILKTFIPAGPSEDEIRKYAKGEIFEKNPKMMGLYIKRVKDKFPTADTSVIVNIVKSLLQ